MHVLRLLSRAGAGVGAGVGVGEERSPGELQKELPLSIQIQLEAQMRAQHQPYQQYPHDQLMQMKEEHEECEVVQVNEQVDDAKDPEGWWVCYDSRL